MLSLLNCRQNYTSFQIVIFVDQTFVNVVLIFVCTFFADIPITNVSGCALVSETNNFPLSVMKIAAKMKKSKPPPPLPHP